MFRKMRMITFRGIFTVAIIIFSVSSYGQCEDDETSTVEYHSSTEPPLPSSTSDPTHSNDEGEVEVKNGSPILIEVTTPPPPQTAKLPKPKQLLKKRVQTNVNVQPEPEKPEVVLKGKGTRIQVQKPSLASTTSAPSHSNDEAEVIEDSEPEKEIITPVQVEITTTQPPKMVLPSRTPPALQRQLAKKAPKARKPEGVVLKGKGTKVQVQKPSKPLLNPTTSAPNDEGEGDAQKGHLITEVETETTTASPPPSPPSKPIAKPKQLSKKIAQPSKVQSEPAKPKVVMKGKSVKGQVQSKPLILSTTRAPTSSNDEGTEVVEEPEKEVEKVIEAERTITPPPPPPPPKAVKPKQLPTKTVQSPKVQSKPAPKQQVVNNKPAVVAKGGNGNVKAPNVAQTAKLDEEYIKGFEARVGCHQGLYDKSKLVERARKQCKTLGINTMNCYKACLYEKSGGYKEGFYQVDKMNSIIDSLFDPQLKDPPSAVIFKQEMLKCAKKFQHKFTNGFPKDYNAKDGCKVMTEFEACVSVSRDCPSTGSADAETAS